ncbi:hypothetical protein [Macrococcus lamae]|uniref:Uncharacterized protein n=1 Tax=Macrococcus lamae TaxID=198484 RepID=A0A4V3BF45_9STAP|nr:hypothetical protein [Macrococcus lamae]TDM12619.1 hypothetical protein ERX29_03140 [Macrococcus lamae]
MNTPPLPVKRWSFLDTINLCLMIFVCLFVIDFTKNPMISWLVIVAFGIWILTVIARNLYISRHQKR